MNGNGALWWDGKGSNGGKTKPKFFYAHSLTGSSSITGLNILNTPVQAFSVDGSTGLTISDVTIDDSAGDAGSLGHNTDAFDVGGSSNILISGVSVKNQDDCLAVNSGTVSLVECDREPLLTVIEHHFHGRNLLWRSWTLDWKCWRKIRQHRF